MDAKMRTCVLATVVGFGVFFFACNLSMDGEALGFLIATSGGMWFMCYVLNPGLENDGKAAARARLHAPLSFGASPYVDDADDPVPLYSRAPLIIVGFTGRQGHGKDTCAEHLVSRHNGTRFAFADALKHGCAQLVCRRHSCTEARRTRTALIHDGVCHPDVFSKLSELSSFGNTSARTCLQLMPLRFGSSECATLSRNTYERQCSPRTQSRIPS